MTVDEARGGQLRALMQWHRANLSRELVGLPPRIRSRPGLSQDDLAELVKVSPRTIVYLESGRLRNPSAVLLDAVATALRMRPYERRSLWTLATGRPPPTQSYQTDPDPALTLLVERLEPDPAIVTDATFAVRAQNHAVTQWFIDFTQLATDDRNLAVWLLTHQHARHVFVDWETVARRVLGRLRTSAARLPHDQALQNVIDRLRAESPEANSLWLHDAGVHYDAPTETRILRRPGHTDPHQDHDGSHHVQATVVTLGPQRLDDERRVIAFLLARGNPGQPSPPTAEVCHACQR